MYTLTVKEELFLKKLNTPSKIQDFLDSISFNHEEGGETCMSPRRVMQTKKANCIEGGMLAALALELQGRRPLLINLKVDTRVDFDHVVAVFKEHGRWGAVSKTNHAVLRYRDPVYATIRELAMSYFHEYFLVTTGKKTMLGYSGLISMRRFGESWATSPEELWDIAEYIYDRPYTEIISNKERFRLRNATEVERKAASLA